jgi:hypothetical protein
MAWRCVFADLLTDANLARFPVDGLRFGRRISAAEEISGSVPVDSVRRAERLRQLVPGRTAVYVYDGPTVLCGGVLWDTVPTWTKRSGETWAFSAATFESYWDQTVISEDVPGQLGVDQLEIARVLVAHLQADPYADIGVRLQVDPAVPLPMSGVLRDRTEYLASANKSYGDALTELGEVLDGFEWTIDVWADPVTGLRTKYLRLGYPRLGRPDATVLVEQQDLEEWQAPADTGTGTRFRARGGTPQGAGSASQQPIVSSVAVRQDLLDAGWPRLDIVEDHASVTDIATLDTYAEQAAARRGAGGEIPQLSVNLARRRVSTLNLGDTLRLRTSTYYDGMRDARYRITGVVMQDGGRTAPPTADLSLEAVPV